jgi:hypothetical protein
VTTICFRVGLREAHALKRLAERQNISMAEACRRAIRLAAAEGRDVKAETLAELVSMRSRLDVILGGELHGA